MNQLLRHPDDPQSQGGGELTPRRAGSVTLRDQQPGADGSPLDPANQSLADALRIMLGLLQLGMVVLAVLYVLSGLQFVQEGEQGIRLLFGATQGPALDPGLQMSAPYPLGELQRINRGITQMEINKEFWVNVPEGTPDGTSIDKLAPTESLKPDLGGSGSVLTADGNIAHTRWQVAYRREDVLKNARNVLPSDEDKLVRAAVKRGIVQACAHVPIDELLKQSSDRAASVASRAKAVAQDTLTGMDCGIVIDQLTLNQTIPPLWIRTDFARVQSAVASAAKAIEAAQGERSSKLSQTAGEAAPLLIKQIEAYEDASLKKDTAAMDATLAKIDALLLGQEVEIDGKKIVGLVSGEVTSKLADAGRYRSAVVTQAKGRYARHEAKLSQFKANPTLMISQEWTTALAQFLKRDSVQVLWAPKETSTLRMQINADPDILREIDKAIKAKEAAASEQKRLDDLNNSKFKTDTTSIKAGG